MIRMLVSAALLLAACGGSGTAASNATVFITSPAPGASVSLGSDALQSVAVGFTTSLTLKPGGTCAGAANCGHIHLVIDTYASPCNGSAGNGSEKYNVEITSGTSGNAQFATCGSAAVGAHNITLELHDDSHNDLKDASGNLIKSTVSITTHL